MTHGRRSNWALWIGFVLSIVAFASYLFVFAKFPVTRDVPWVNFLLFGGALALVAAGLRRVLGQAGHRRSKITGGILGVASLAIFGFFCFFIFYSTRQLPASISAPQIGQKAPDFALQDASGDRVALTTLLSAPMTQTHALPKGVLLIFYRGYW